MKRDQAIRVLRAHAGEIRARGVTRLALFGSTARGDSRADSDVDVMVDIDEHRKFSLIDLSELRLFLCDILGREVDLVEREGLKPYARDGILADAVDVIG